MQRKIKKDTIVGIILVLIGIVMTIMSMQIKVKGGGTDPGSRLFPLMACGLIIVCGAIVTIMGQKTEGKPFVDKEGWGRILLFFAIMIVYTLALKYIGFIISTPFFLFAMTGLLAGGKKTNLIGRIIYSIVITAACYYIFKGALNMMLPTGLLLK